MGEQKAPILLTSATVEYVLVLGLQFGIDTLFIPIDEHCII